MEFSAAVEYVIRREGVDILGHPTRFLGYMLDCADLDTTEMIVLERNCDEQMLGTFLRAARAATSASLAAAAKNVAANLTRTRMIASEAAEATAEGMARGIARAQGIAYQAVPVTPVPVATPTPAQNPKPSAKPVTTPTPQPVQQTVPAQAPKTKPSPKPNPSPRQSPGSSAPTPKHAPKPTATPVQAPSAAPTAQPVASGKQPAKKGVNPLLAFFIILTAVSLWYWKFPRTIGPLRDATPLYLKIMSSSLEGSAVITAKGIYEDEVLGPKFALLVEYRPSDVAKDTSVEQRYMVESTFHHRMGSDEVVYRCNWDSDDSVIEFGFPDIEKWSEYGVFEGAIEVTRIDAAGHETVGSSHEWNIDINNWFASLYTRLADLVWSFG